LAGNTPEQIPALLLGWLAVDLAHQGQGQGLGWSLLQHAIDRAWAARSVIGLRALVADPIDDSATVFYLRYGFRPFPAGSGRLFLPLRTAERRR
jgi:GNAT superfamily N-acetyltransferase